MKKEQIKHAVLHGAAGDALGYISEFDRNKRPISGYRKFNVTKGGRYNRYICPVDSGDYTDDAEYTIGVGHCLLGPNDFNPRIFEAHLAYYVKFGTTGGRSMKKMGTRLNRRKKPFSFYDKLETLFYKAQGKDRAYWDQKGTGVLMRISLMAYGLASEESRLNAVYENGILTHGSPEALFTAAVHCELLRHLYQNPDSNIYNGLFGILEGSSVDRFLPSSDRMNEWMTLFNKYSGREFKKECETGFSKLVDDIKEAESMIGEYPTLCYNTIQKVLEFNVTGQLASNSFLAAFVLSHMEAENNSERLIQAANMGRHVKMDTDTVCAVLGQMLGIRDTKTELSTLESTVQDKSYLCGMADAMYAIEHDGMVIKRTLGEDWHEHMIYSQGMWHPLFGPAKCLWEDDSGDKYTLRRLIFRKGKSMVIKISK